MKNEQRDLQRVYKFCKVEVQDFLIDYYERFSEFQNEINRLKKYITDEVFKLTIGERFLYIFGDGSEIHNTSKFLEKFEKKENSKFRFVSFNLDEFGIGYCLIENPEFEFDYGEEIHNWYIDNKIYDSTDSEYKCYADSLNDLFRQNSFFEVDKIIIYIWYLVQFNLPNSGVWAENINTIRNIFDSIEKNELEEEIKKILKGE